MTVLLDRESCSGNLCRLVIGIQERRGSLSVSDKADDHQCGGAGDSAWHRGTKAKGGADKLPTNAHHKARCHAGDNAGLGGLLPVQGCEGRQTRGGGIEAPGEHEDVIGILDVQSDDQCAQWQDEGKHAGQAQFLLLGDIGLEDLINIVDTGLDGDDEIAVRRGHDDRQDTRQSKTRQAHRQNLNGQGRFQTDRFLPKQTTVEDKLRAAETFLDGGTDFCTPMNEALRLMQEEGFDNADIVFITDGECLLPEEYISNLQKEQSARRFTITGILLDQESKGMDFSLKAFCQNIYRTSELTGDAVVAKVINDRI